MRAPLLLPLLLVAACSGATDDASFSPGADTGVDAITIETAAVDSAAPDAAIDDADSTVTEAATDALPDAPSDTAAPRDAPADARPDTATDASGAFCGGITGKPCASGYYCKMETGSCRTSDAGGTCAPIPSGCTKELNPVCGCDGRDYSNPCMAAAAGVNVASTGACTAPTGDCGGKLGAKCSAKQFCDYPDATRCGATDALGTCRPRPEICSGLYDPVCGCDGKTYSNLCAAHAAGVDDASKGACPP